MSLNTEPSIGLRQRNAPAVAAFQTRNLQASKEFHVDRKNIFDEPHKTNAVRNFREKYWESFLRSSEKSLLNSGTIISILFSLYFVFNQQFPTVLGKTITSYIPFVSGWATEKVLEFSEIFSIGLTLCLGIFSLVSNGLIIAYLDYQKTTEYKEFYTNEKKREDWEYENYIEGEQNEMIELYEAKGLSKVDAETVIKILSKQKQFFVDVMMKEELELMPPDERNPTLTATVIFFSYIFVGMTPLLPFIISFKYNLNYYVIIISAFVITESLFVCFGIFKSSFTMNRWWTVSLQMAVNGLLAFAIPFVFAQVTSYLFMNPLNTVHLNL